MHPGLAAQNSRPTLSPHGDAVAVQQVDGIAVWDVEAVARRSKTAPLDAIAADMAFDPEGRFLAFVPNRREGPPARVYHHVNGALAVLPPGERLRSPVAAGHGPGLRLFDTTDGSPVALHDELAAYGGSSVQPPLPTRMARRWCGIRPPTSTWSCGRTTATGRPAAMTSTGSG